MIYLRDYIRHHKTVDPLGNILSITLPNEGEVYELKVHEYNIITADDDMMVSRAKSEAQETQLVKELVEKYNELFYIKDDTVG